MFFVTISDKTKRRLLAITGLVLLLVVARLGLSRSPWEQPVTGSAFQTLSRVQTSAAQVTLTFDVTWGTEVLGGVRQVLEQNGVKATFFVAGPWARANTAEVEALLEAGHEVGSLGYRQIDLTEAEPEELEKELDEAQAAFTETLEISPVYFRPPVGRCDDTVVEAAMGRGQTVILWSVDSGDWTNPGPEKIAENVLGNVRKGDIILFHADDSCPQLVEALGLVIAGLREKQLEPVTLSTLLGAETE